ncbi:indoleamine 2,3-dioxygenase 1 [Callorhinchus milii]|uniref:Indoleamine 2,3-dioxygenase 1 n=1 Tax=Callorhinchus milii TaxID=7868 RepID=V9KTM5_CALMI|nr:indoleamine 2,3-dioxygenase 1 [Callorhinchus milii]|eukprot:gi/632987121/ref/XP_007910616.1/ PREDICTED: indoleamine 2,3-dioxygenase 2-like [Callorhinchus milii]
MARRENGLCIDLEKFHVSEACGFVLPEPLTVLPGFYQPWMEMANSLTGLIEQHQLRREVNQMQLLSTNFLTGHKQLRLAHLALSFITMGYVWQDGETNTTKVLPRNLAVPFCKVSEILGLPPILVHADCVLANWKKKDPNGSMEFGNLDTIFVLPGGDSLKGFFLVTLLVEMAAVQGIKAVSVAAGAVLRPDDDSLENALQDLAKSIKQMKEALKKMDDHVDPATFYGVIRLFLSGWKDNPAIPEGLLYEGVAEETRQYSGGSAAQSSTLHCFDEFLGIRHNRESAGFLDRMRDYMPPSHKALIQIIASGPSVREYIVSKGSPALRETYNNCVAALVDLRNHHITVVTRYISITAAKAKAEKAKQTGSAHVLQRAPSALEERGTGGSGIMCFLKNVRDTTKRGMIDI